jgi:hypothetical protein
VEGALTTGCSGRSAARPAAEPGRSAKERKHTKVKEITMPKKNQLASFFDGQPDIVARDMEIETFAFQIRFASWPFPDEFKISYSNVFYQAIFEIMAEAGLRRSSLDFTSPEAAIKYNQRGGNTGWFAIAHKEPGKEFALTIDDTTFQIRSSDLRLETIVWLADKVYSRITDALRSAALAGPARLVERAHTIQYILETSLRLGDNKIQGDQVKNWQILCEALGLNQSPKGKGKKATADAFQSVGVEEYIRLDVTQHALKKIDGCFFNTGIIVEAPFNERNTILNIRSFLGMEEDFEFELDKGLNWDTALVSFFREIILKRFYENLLCTTKYTYK